MSVKMLLSFAVMIAAAKEGLDSRLIGSWNLNGKPYIEFRADGTGGTPEGDAFAWSAARGNLIMRGDDDTAQARYRFEGARLVADVDGETLVLEKAGKGKGKAAPGKGKPAAGGGGDDLSRLLLSSAWCSFSYNKVSGSSKQSRAVFSPNGTWSLGSRAEGYSSGYAGTVSSQHDGGDGGRWKVQGGRLFMSSSEEPSLAPVDLKVARNSNGHPILTADGVEYSSCR